MHEIESLDTRYKWRGHTQELRAFEICDPARTAPVIVMSDQVALTLPKYGRFEAQVCLTNGAGLPGFVPLLDGHSDAPEAVLGSVRDLKVRAGRVLGVAYFGNTPRAYEVWRQAQGNKKPRVSAEYLIPTDHSIILPAGESIEYRGRAFQAPQLECLRIALKWLLCAVSVVESGADPEAKFI